MTAKLKKEIALWMPIVLFIMGVLGFTCFSRTNLFEPFGLFFGLSFLLILFFCSTEFCKKSLIFLVASAGVYTGVVILLNHLNKSYLTVIADILLVLILWLYVFRFKLKKSKQSLIEFCQFTLLNILFVPVLVVGILLTGLNMYDEYFSDDAKYMEKEFDTIFESETGQSFLEEMNASSAMSMRNSMSKTSKVSLCSSVRLTGVALDYASLIVSMDENGSVPEDLSEIGIFPKAEAYTGTDKILLLYSDLFDGGLEDFLQAMKSEEFLEDNRLSEFINQLSYTTIWNAIFLNLGFYLFVLPSLIYVIKLITLLALKAPVVKKKRREADVITE